MAFLCAPSMINPHIGVSSNAPQRGGGGGPQSAQASAPNLHGLTRLRRGPAKWSQSGTWSSPNAAGAPRVPNPRRPTNQTRVASGSPGTWDQSRLAGLVQRPPWIWHQPPPPPPAVSVLGPPLWPAALGQGPPPLWDRSGPRAFSAGAFVGLNGPGPAAWRVGLPRLGTTEAPTTLQRDLAPLWDH